jgi:hypothetical protein
VEVVARKLLDRRWGLTASYVWSRLYGNYSGLSESDENGRTEPNIGGGFDAPMQMFGNYGEPVYGRLATDRPHQVKAQFIYMAPAGFNVGIFQSVASGVPVSRFATVTQQIGDQSIFGIAPMFLRWPGQRWADTGPVADGPAPAVHAEARQRAPPRVRARCPEPLQPGRSHLEVRP